MRGYRCGITALMVAWTAACGPAGAAPDLDPLEDATAFPGRELRLGLRAADDDVEELRFSFANHDLFGIDDRAEIRNYGGGNADFLYTPISDDVGEHAFDFSVVDEAGLTDVETIWIDVVPGGSSAPVFREPLGTGTTLDTAQFDCLDLDVVVEDSDTPEVTISEEPPFITGATFRQEGAFTAAWRWCPSESQRAALGSHALILAASDGENPPTMKNFLILLR